jgi:hypothetical protein
MSAAATVNRSKVPPCVAGAPAWLVAVRDEYVNTGSLNLKVVVDNLSVGEKLVAAWSEYKKTSPQSVSVIDLPFDERRTWRIDRCEAF